MLCAKFGWNWSRESGEGQMLTFYNDDNNNGQKIKKKVHFRFFGLGELKKESVEHMHPRMNWHRLLPHPHPVQQKKFFLVLRVVH